MKKVLNFLMVLLMAMGTGNGIRNDSFSGRSSGNVRRDCLAANQDGDKGADAEKGGQW